MLAVHDSAVRWISLDGWNLEWFWYKPTKDASLDRSGDPQHVQFSLLNSLFDVPFKQKLLRCFGLLSCGRM